jgi:toxin-antitoxin system PIN domain toxin
LRAIDTNVLVYAAHAESPFQAIAASVLRELVEGDEPWALPWPCAYEFLKVVTHPRLFRAPLPMAEALDRLESVMDSPSLSMLGPGPSHRAHMRRALLEGGARGSLVHDANLLALLLENGVTEVVTADRDFSRFPSLRVSNPFA